MRNLLRAVAPLIVTIALGVPLLASALPYCDPGYIGKDCIAQDSSYTAGQPVGGWCMYNSDCSSGSCSWIKGCEASSNTQAVFGSNGGGGRGGVSFYYLLGYRDQILYAINSLFVPILFAVAFLVFIYSIYKYFILGADKEEERTTGKYFAFWAVIGFAVIVSIWGLVWVVVRTFNIQPGGAAPAPPLL